MESSEDKITAVVQGTLNLIEWRGPSIVLAEAWPIWSFALSTLNSKDLVTYCKFVSGKGRKEFKATSLGCTLVKSLDKVTRFCKRSKAQLLVFLQGSAAFYQQMELYARMMDNIDVISAVEGAEVNAMDFQGHGNGGKSHLISHQEV